MRPTALFAVPLFALLVAFTPLDARAECVGGAKNGVLEAGEQCDGGATDNCCKPDCTWRPVTTSQEGKCVDPSNPCQQGRCQADHSCDLSSTTAVPGHPSCVNINSACLLGECYNKDCKPIGNESGQWAPRCPPDDDPCRKDECRVSANGTFIECRYTEPQPVDTNCSVAEGLNCVMQACDGEGNCEPTGAAPPTCSGTPSVCEEFKCNPGGPGVPASCSIVQKPIGTDCDTNPWDCKHQQCKSNGSCGNQPAGAGERCDPGTDNNHCQLGTCGTGANSCGNVVNVDYGVVQFDDPPSLPLCPDNTVCTVAEYCDGNGGCIREGSGSADGTACETDNNNCTLDVCNATGTCTHNQADASQQGQTCTSFNTCALAAACDGALCMPTSCATTGFCANCSGLPACTNGIHCGCD